MVVDVDALPRLPVPVGPASPAGFYVEVDCGTLDCGVYCCGCLRTA